MDCGSCRHDNEPNAKFCSECGAPLSLRCPACDAEQPSGSKFCNQCGTAIGAAERPIVAAGRSVAVRKQVTALFADLVGSTAFGEQVDPEAARAALGPYFEILQSTIEDHAGTVAKFTGDGVLAIFGVPEVAEDDALRAVAAGQALQDRFRAFAEDVRQRHGVELGLRVGINTGELVVGDDDADMVGDVLNTASRLEATCTPGRVLVGEDTWRMTRSSIAYEVLGEVRVKGKSEAIATFQVVTGALGHPEDVTPFVGRSAELETLRSVFSDTVSASSAHLVTVIGAPGVGKTRLAAELRGTSTARTFDLRFERRGSTTFTPIADLLRELTGSGSVEDVERLVAAHPEAVRLAPILASFLSHGEARSTEESFWAVRRLFEQLAADTPVIIVVDDIQWAEPLFWDLLEHLVEWTEAPVLLVALARPEIRELRPDLARSGKRVSAAIDVEGLDADTTRELAARLLGADELPPDLVDRLPDSTEGNPLFVRELVQMLVDDGVLARTGDRWHLTIDVDAIEVPPTILSLLASRVERLPDDERQVVELASVIGTEFDRGLLGSIAGPDIGGRLGALIDRLRRKDLVEPSGTWAGDHPVYRFHHVLVRDAAYRRLLKGHRADLHERVGRYLEDHSGSGDDGDVVVAHHYEQVHRYRSELGTVDAATQLLAERAVVRLRSAAEQALAREDLASSGSYAIRALALAGDGDERDELLVLGCEALLSSGDVSRGAPLVAEFRSRELDERLAAWADCFHAQLWSLTDSARLSEATDLADDAAGRLDALDDSAGVAKARLVRASTLARLGRVGDCEAELDLALGAARAAGDRRRTVAVLGAAPLAALWGPSPVARAGGRCLDVLRLLRITTSSPAVEATSIRCQGMLEALRGRFDSARQKFETSRTTARDLGLRHGLYETELFEGFVELIAGDPVAAEPHLILARDGLGALGIGADAGQASALLARALLRQGRLDEADVLASAALETAGENLQTAVASRSVLGEIRVQQGRPDEARQLVADALAIVERTDITIDHAIARRSAARVADHLGDTQEAKSHRAAAERLLADKGVTGLMEARPEYAVAATSQPSDTPDDVEAQQPAILPGNAAWEVNDGIPATSASASGTDRGLTEFTDTAIAAHQTSTPLLKSELVNDETRLGNEYNRVWLRGNIDDEQFLEPDYESSSRRASTPQVRGGREVFEGLRDFWRSAGAQALSDETLAIRGDHLALHRLTTRMETGDEISVLAIGQLGPSGRWSRHVCFDETQRAEAQVELDGLWMDELGFPADHPARSIAANSYETDPVRAAEGFHPDLTFVNHRRLAYESGGWSTLADVLASADFEMVVTMPRIHRLGDRGAVVEWVETAVDEFGENRMILIVLWEDGLTVRLEGFDTDDLDAALARYDELVTETSPQAAPPTITNTAWVVTQLAFEAGNIDDRDGYTALHSDRFETVDHERFTLEPGATMNRDDYVASVFDKEDLGADITAFGTLIAIRDDDLCLVTTTFSIDDYLMERLVIVQTEDRQIIRTDWFDHTDLPAALDHLDHRWVALGGPAEEVRVASAFWDAQRAGDVDAARQLLHPDFVMTDHGRLGVGQLGIDDHLETAVHGAHGVVAIPIQYVAHTDSVALARIRFTTPDDSAWEHWVVTNIAHGLTRSVDMFDLDDLEAAMTCYEELVAISRQTESIWSTPIPDSMRNRAVEVLEQAEWDDVITLNTFGDHALRLADDFTFVGRRHSAPHFDAGAEHLVSTHQMWNEMGFVEDQSDLIAVRGDDLALFRGGLSGDQGELEFLVIIETGADRLIHSWTVFDSDQLYEALDELDRQWTASGGRPDPVAAAVARAMSTGPFDAYAELFAPDFVCADHRELGFGVRSRDEWLDSTRALVGQVTTPGAQEYLAIDDGISLSRVLMSSKSDDSVWPLWLINQHDGERAVRWEEFAIDQRTQALARYHELAGTTASVPVTPTNAATRLIDEYTAALNDGDLDRFAAAFHPEVRQELHQRLRVADAIGNRGMADLGRSIIAGGGVLECEPVAIFGDQLAVCRQLLRLGDDEIGECSVVEVADGVIIRVISFDDDQLVEALDTFDRRAVELGRPAALADTEITTRGAHWRHDIEAFAAALDPLWSFHDHRRLGLGQMTREQYLTSSFPTGPGEVLYWAVELLAHTDSVWLAHDRWLAANGSGWDQLHVGVLRSGLGLSSDTFDLIDLDATRACYDQRVAEVSGSHDAQQAHTGQAAVSRPAQESLPFTNATWEWSQACTRAVEASDRARLLDLMADDFLAIARYSLNVGQELTRSAFTESLLAQQADGNDTRLDIELIALRGDECALVRLDWFIDDNLMEFLIVNHVVDGLGKRMVMFDETQLMDALDELDRQWAEHGGPARVLEHTVALRRAIHDGDLEDARAVLSPAFQANDHRQLGLPTLDRDAYLAAPKGGSGTQLLVVDVPHHADNASLERIQVTLEDGWSTMEMWAVISLDEHGIVTIDNYDIADADATRARFDELMAEGSGSQPRKLSNRAWEVSREMIAAHSVGDRSRCASQLADDLVWVAHDPVMQFASPESELDREAWLDVVFHEDLAGDGHLSSGELIAIRGDSLCLNLVTSTAANGDVSDRLYLTEIDAAGRCTRIDSFRTEQLREAYDELDRRYLETLPLDHEAVPKARHWYATDSDGVAAILHPRFRFRDHRKLAWPDADRDAMLTYAGTLPPGSYATVPEIFRVTEREFVIRRVQFMEEGTASTDSIVVGRVEDGLLIEMDWYEPDELDAALARYDELVRASSTVEPGALTNSATRLEELLATAGANGDRSRFTDLLSDEFTSVTHEQLRFTGDQLPDRDTFVQQIFDVFDLAADVEIDSTPVAIRGDDLCLMHVVTHLDADELDKYVVVESAGDRITATEWFDLDDLATALDVLDRRWADHDARAEPPHELTSTPAPPVPEVANQASETWVAFGKARRNNGLASARPLLHPDFRFESRRASAPRHDGDRDDYLSAISTFEEEGIADDSMEVLAVRGDHLALCDVDFENGSELEVLNVVRVDDEQRLLSITAFDGTQLTEALEELDRQWFDLLGLPDDHIARRMGHIVYSTDPEQLLSIASPDVVYGEHRRLWLEGGGPDELGDLTRSMTMVDHVVIPLIHRLSERFFLLEKHNVGPGGEISAMLIVTGVTDGLVSNYDIYDVDDLPAALERYEELVAESATPAAADRAPFEES